MFTQLSTIFGLSLRVQEQCFTQLTLVIAITYRNKLYLPYLVALLLLKAKNEEMYEGLVKGNARIKEVTDFIGQTAKGKEFLFERLGIALEIFLMESRLPNDEPTKLLFEEYKKQNLTTNLPELQAKKAKRIVQYFENIEKDWLDNRTGAIVYLAQRIGLSEPFNTK